MAVEVRFSGTSVNHDYKLKSEWADYYQREWTKLGRLTLPLMDNEKNVEDYELFRPRTAGLMKLPPGSRPDPGSKSFEAHSKLQLVPKVISPDTTFDLSSDESHEKYRNYYYIA